MFACPSPRGSRPAFCESSAGLITAWSPAFSAVIPVDPPVISADLNVFAGMSFRTSFPGAVRKALPAVEASSAPTLRGNIRAETVSLRLKRRSGHVHEHDRTEDTRRMRLAENMQRRLNDITPEPPRILASSRHQRRHEHSSGNLKHRGWRRALTLLCSGTVP